jgi:ribosome-associated protein
MRRLLLDTLPIARSIVEALEEKKGEDILLIDIRELTVFAEYFVICTATSERMLQALIDSAIEKAKAAHSLPGRIEGVPADGWMLADFGDVILHVFSTERRQYYRLDELWSQGKVLLRLI